MDGCRVITYDGHLSTEVVDMMKSNQKKFTGVLHFIVQRLQAHVKDQFTLNKKSLKLKKGKTYKDGKGSGSQTPRPYVLAKQWDRVQFAKIRDQVLKAAEKDKPKKDV